MDAEIQGYLTEFGILRGQIRDAIKGMGDEAANWHPLPQEPTLPMPSCRTSSVWTASGCARSSSAKP